MEEIDREISAAECKALVSQNAALVRQNQLLKQQVAQLRAISANCQKELSVYKSIVLKNSSDSQVLEMQHQRIFELQTQVELLQGKYNKLLKTGGSSQVVEHALTVKDYEQRLKDSQAQHARQVAALKAKLVQQGANELIESKRLFSSPLAEIKKSSKVVGKLA